MSDLKSIRQEPPEGCSASPHGDENLFVWGATIFGPDDTAWEGGIFFSSPDLWGALSREATSCALHN